MRNWKPIIALLILSSTIPELTTGSTPIYRYINPAVFLLLTLAYGIPALVYRELAIIRGYGLKQLAILGLLQGIYVEGLLVNTYYNPGIDKNGVFGRYGRILGVNWPWATYLTIFHSIYSVMVPILLVESIYSQTRGMRLVGNRTLKVLVVIAAITALAFNASPETYKPPEQYHLLSLVFMAAVYVIVEESINSRLPRVISYPERYLLLYPIVLIIVSFYGLTKILPPPAHILLGVFLYITLLALLDNTDHRDRLFKWRLPRDLLAGMNITGIITGLLNPPLLHVLIPNTIFLVWLFYMDKRLRLFNNRGISREAEDISSISDEQ